MDALDAYGSDAENSSTKSSFSSPTNRVGNNKAGLSSLLGAYDDSSSDGDHYNENEDMVRSTSRSTSRLTTKTSNTNSLVLPPAKKAKRDNKIHDDTTTSQFKITLPKPPLNNPSMVSWTIDYLSVLESSSLSSPSSSSAHNSSSVADIWKNHQLTSSVTWANRLKSQHEFNNPHFFQNVVEHFGIKSPLATNSSLLESKLQDYDWIAIGRSRNNRMQSSTSADVGQKPDQPPDSSTQGD